MQEKLENRSSSFGLPQTSETFNEYIHGNNFSQSLGLIICKQLFFSRNLFYFYFQESILGLKYIAYDSLWDSHKQNRLVLS